MYEPSGNSSDPLFVMALLLGPDGHAHWRLDRNLTGGSVPADGVVDVLSIPQEEVSRAATSSGGVTFLRLELRRASQLGYPVAVNHYWLGEHQD